MFINKRTAGYVLEHNNFEYKNKHKFIEQKQKTVAFIIINDTNDVTCIFF